jgi:hypothetical protein
MSPRLIDFLTNGISLTAVLLGFVFGIASHFGLVKDEDLLKYIVFLLSTLAGTELFDRWQRLSKLQKSVDDVTNLIKKSDPSALYGKYLVGREEIVRALRPLYEDVEDQIRAALMSGGNSPTELAYDLAKAIRAREDSGGNMSFHAVICVDYSNPPKHFIDMVESKYDIYAVAGIEGRVQLRLLDQKPVVGNDFVILGGKHVVLLIPDTIRESRDNAYKAVLLEDKPDLAQTLSTWFEREVWSKSEDYEKAKPKLNIILNDVNPDNNQTDEAPTPTQNGVGRGW